MAPTDLHITPALATALADLPAKMRVHELAKRAGMSSKEAIAALADRGVTVASAASSVTAEAATDLLTALLGEPEPAPVEPAAELPVEPAKTPRQRRPRAPRPVAEPAAEPGGEPVAEEPAAGASAIVPLFLPPEPTAAPAKRTRSRAAKTVEQPAVEPAAELNAATAEQPQEQPAPKRSRRRRAADPQHTDQLVTETATAVDEVPADTAEPAGEQASADSAEARPATRRRRRGPAAVADVEVVVTEPEPGAESEAVDQPADLLDESAQADDTEGEQGEGTARRRRRRGRRGRGRTPDADGAEQGETDLSDADTVERDRPEQDEQSEPAEPEDGEETEGADDGTESSVRRRRRRRRRTGTDEPGATRDDDPDNTVVHVREARSAATEVQGVRGSTRLEAKRQRRRDTRDSRRRPQILTEAEFLARREAVDRVMAVRQRGDLAQVALLEDGVLVEHFVSRAGSESMMGNIYLGRVQNVLPSMEAAFIDIGRGRNAVLYAGEVNWDAAGLAGKSRRIETALTSGDTMLVQVSKDPIGHKGARLTTQISLPGRFLVYVPGGGATGISRKLPDTERKRLKAILDRIVPQDAGVIIRTAAEGVAEEELARDVERLKAQWEEISGYAEKNKGNTAPVQLSSEPDTLIKVVRDLFNSDISTLVVDGAEAYRAVSEYVQAVAPELSDRVRGYEQPAGSKADVFSSYRIDEQIAKALERKVHLPSGGSLVIDRTEAMTVVDVNTGKYTGSGGNLEETVTRNNLEAAEEIVRQLRLRDIGGIIVIDFIDMVLESNRELVLRRLTECLGRDRTRHQVAEVTSLGLVQMTRKKMGTGLVEAFSEPCTHCNGRGIILRDVPVDPAAGEDDGERRTGRRRGKARTEPVPEPAKVTVPVVRPPDPRGPKPPVRGTAGEENGSADRGISDDAAAAVTAVLAALDAQQAAAAAVPAAAPSTASDEASTVVEPAQDATVPADIDPSQSAPAEAVDAPAAGGRRRRGRRAAGRPAGAPSNDIAPVVITVPERVATAEPISSPELVAAPEPQPVSVTVDTPAPKRRRRAASRPAGPAGA